MKTLPVSRVLPLSRLTALALLILLLTLPARPGLAQSAPQAVSIGVGGDNITRLLWNNSDGSVSLWRINSDNSVTAYTYGPFGGWSAQSLAVGSDNISHILWDNSGGSEIVWDVNNQGVDFKYEIGYGPYPGYTASAVAVGPANAIRVLWTNPSGGALLWNLSDPHADYSYLSYGPYTGWATPALAVGPDSVARLLWTRTDGTALVWKVDGAGGVSSGGTDPAPGWAALSVAVDGGGSTHLLWDHPSTSTIMLWTVSPNYTTSLLAGLTSYNSYTDPVGFRAKALACGPDGKMRLLWTKLDGTVQVWVIAADGTYTATTYFTVPSGLTATPGDGTVSLDWTGPFMGGDSYNLYRGTSPGGESLLKKGLNSTPYQDTGLTDGVTYYYQVSAVTNKRESALSTEVAVTPQPPAPPPASHLTQAQAVSLAQAFCQAVGAPVTATATATWPAPNPSPGQPPYHWQNRWDIQFGSQAEVEVVDATGVISHYYNFALSQQLQTANNPAGTPLSESSAVQAATSALQASGQSGELASTPTDQNFQITAPPTQAGDLWMVTWGRQYQGIPYRQQQATVMLQAETGALQAFSLTFPSPPPGAGPGSITSSQAAQAAQAAQTTLANAGYSNLTQQSVTLQVVQPNNQWHTGAYSYAVTPGPPPSRVAWDCVFTDANNTVYEVWVDSTYQTITIDGGEVYGIAGLRRHAKPQAKTHTKTRSKTRTLAKTPAPKKTQTVKKTQTIN